MKILKYLLIVVIALALYITYPIWQLTPGTGSVDISQIDEEKVEAKPRMLVEEEALIEAEKKFGPKPHAAYKSRVPDPVQRQWDAMLKENESIYDDICEPLTLSDKGWTTACQFKIKHADGTSERQLKSYTIKNGKILQGGNVAY